MIKDFITTQKAFNKIVEEKLEKLDNLVSKVDNLAHDVEILKIRTTPLQDKPTKSLNSLSIQINNNESMLAHLYARWAREGKEANIVELNSSTVNVCFVQTSDDLLLVLEDDDIDIDNYNLTEVKNFLQKIAKSPDASNINIAFTEHITNALIKAKEERLQLETSTPIKLQDGWDPTIKMKINDFDFNALCDLGASVSVIYLKVYTICLS